MRLCVNWLPVSPDLTREVSRRVEDAGLWGIGIGDSPNYGELYAACRDALVATDRLVVSTNVTNPVTRHVSVHTSAARTFQAAHPGRFRLGFGRGDSAVRTFGLTPAPLATMAETLDTIRAAVPDVPLLVAASGPVAARLAGRVADGVVAGVGTDPVTLGMIAREGASTRAADRAPLDVWASIRLAVARDEEHLAQLRGRLTPRVVSASHFAFASTVANKNVPPEFAEILTERYRRYDYGSHGRSGSTPNAELFADHPEIETYLLDRFAICDTAAGCRTRLAELHRHVDGIYLSLLFEDVLDQVDLIADMLGAPATGP